MTMMGCWCGPSPEWELVTYARRYATGEVVRVDRCKVCGNATSTVLTAAMILEAAGL